MSTIEVSEAGVRIPVWAVGVVMTLAIGWMAWMSGAIVSTKPEGTEKALQELRSRMNAELAARDAIAKLATENAVNISYLVRDVEALKSHKP